MENKINPAKAQLERVTKSTRQTLWNLLQYMLFEASPSGKNVANEDGSFDYKYFDNYFTDNDRDAYLIKSETGELMGFVMINQYLQKVKTGHSIAELLVLPGFRRNGVGREVARRCFVMYPGNWEVGPADGSKSAYKFWKNVIDEITGEDNQLEDGVFVFNNGGKMSDIVEQITTLVRQKSDEYQANDPGHYDFWNEHLKYVYSEAIELAKKYGADLEIVQLGALLHDIALLEKVGTKTDHHENGKKLAEQILREYNYPEDKLEQVLGCVLHHRSSKNTENLEELCVADADILAHFDNIPMLFDSAYNRHDIVGLNNIRDYMRNTFVKDFNDLSDKTKNDFVPKYKTICEVVLGKEL